MVRIGQGFDIHRLVEGRKLILGGIEIPYDKGCLGHSDGDVLIHSIVDAILGAIGERDIGYHFPNNSDDIKDIDSKIILKKTINLAYSKGFKIINIDSTIIINKPKLQPYIPDMRKTLSEIIKISTNMITIKAKTTEGFFYTDEGVMAFSSVLVKKKNFILLLKSKIL